MEVKYDSLILEAPVRILHGVHDTLKRGKNIEMIVSSPNLNDVELNWQCV